VEVHFVVEVVVDVELEQLLFLLPLLVQLEV
jgi:hypothetical protein